MTTDAPHSSTVRLRSGTGVALIAATVLSSMAGFLDASVVNVAIPAIGRDLGANLQALQWSLTGYLLTAAALLLVSGALADKYGRRRILITGLLVMLAASTVCAIAPSFGVLIGARIVQGVGAALVVPSSLALLNGTLQGKDRATGIGVWAGLSSLGTLAGPFVGGWFVDHVSWRAVFLLNVPLILGAILSVLPVPESAAERGHFSLDTAGAVLAVLGLAGLIDGLTAGSTTGWANPRVIIGLVVGVIGLALLVPVERRVRSPMLKLSLFQSRQFSAINAATVAFYGALAAANYLVILRSELTLGYSAAGAGAVFIPSSIVFIALAPVSGALVARFGAGRLMAAGMLSVGAGYVWLAFSGTTGSYATTLLPGILLGGLGLGLSVTPLTAAVLAAVSDTDLGEASAISDVAARLGSAVMVALVPALIGVRASRGLMAALQNGFRPAMLVLAGLCVVAAAISLVFVRKTQTAGQPTMHPPANIHACALPQGPAPQAQYAGAGHQRTTENP